MLVLLAQINENRHWWGSCLIKRRPGYALVSLYMSGSCDISLNIFLISSSSLNIFWSQDLSSGKEENSIHLSDCVNLITWSPCMPYHEFLCFSQRKTWPLFILMIGSKLEKSVCNSEILAHCSYWTFLGVRDPNIATNDLKYKLFHLGFFSTFFSIFLIVVTICNFVLGGQTR